ncbi:hypothetical protein [Microlunatus speluncae]|uniref:hypothetical protein n=1 Tax=Microlunatus speluncae TaxID=2594267 RepID=UPI001266818C|nr:hypothetical protein [Microlunatus speluncae]
MILVTSRLETNRRDRLSRLLCRVPLFRVVGPPGAGKTTLLPPLVKLDIGIVIIEEDELFENGTL